MTHWYLNAKVPVLQEKPQKRNMAGSTMFATGYQYFIKMLIRSK